MKKLLKKTLCLCVALCFAFAGFACDGGLTNNTTKKPAKGQIQIAAFDGGYKLDWLNTVKDEFMRQNPGTTVIIRALNTGADQNTAHNNVKAGIYVGDMLLDTVSVTSDAALGYYYNLNDVYASKPDGDDGKTVTEKLGKDVINGFRHWDGNFYEVPAFDGWMGLQYNKTSLDTMLGAGNWEEPRTTDELLALCNRVKATGNTPFIYSLDSDAGYTSAFIQELYVQLLGYDNAMNAGHGIINGSRDTDGNDLFNIKGRTECIEDCARFFSASSQMVDTVATDLSFIAAQGYFWGVNQGQGKNNAGSHKLAAFQVNGDWNYNETRASYGGIVSADIRCMKTPISSYILNVLPDETIESDAELSALVKAIDENEAALLESIEVSNNVMGEGFNCSRESFKRVYEARKVYIASMTQQKIAVPKNCGDFELAKKFLTFLASDAVAYYKAVALDGLTAAYCRDGAVLEGVAKNEFVTSRENAIKGGIPVMTLCQFPASTFYSPTPTVNNIHQILYDGTFKDTVTSLAYKNNVLSNYRQRLADNKNSIEIADEVSTGLNN